MKKNELTITMDSRGDDIDALAALEVLSETISLLRDVEKARLGGAKAEHRWYISNATKTNPFELTIDGVVSHERGSALDPVSDFLGGLKFLESGSGRPELFSDAMLDRVKKICNRVGKNLAALVFRDSKAHVFTVTHKLAIAAAAFELPEFYTEYGELDGALGQLTAHGDTHDFCIYDDLTNKKIHCEFDPADFNRVKEALRKRVRVSGRIEHKRRDHSPQKVFVDHWGTLPDEDDLPSIESVHAMKFDLTRGRPSEEVIADLRRLNA